MASHSMAKIVVMYLGPESMTTTAVAGGALMSSNGGGTSSLWTCDWFVAPPAIATATATAMLGVRQNELRCG